MKLVKNEKGIALVTALLLTLIGLGIIMAVLYMVTQGTKVSGAHKRYRSALEASYAAPQIVANDILPRIFSNVSTLTIKADLSSIGMQFGTGVGSACLHQKLEKSSNLWSACPSGSTTADPKTAWDVTFKLKGSNNQTNYQVYSKIIDTLPGNSDLSGFELLDAGAGVTGASSGVSPKHMPALYRIEIEGAQDLNPKEKAQLSVLYAF